jgi:hypothetical protein
VKTEMKDKTKTIHANFFHIKDPSFRMSLSFFYPVRNNVLLLFAGLDFRIIPAGFKVPLGFESQRLKFLTGLTFLDRG